MNLLSLWNQLSMIKHKGTNILIVDDDVQIIELIKMFLSMNFPDVNCVLATDAKTAALKITNQEFDLVIVDFQMPGRSGIEFALGLRKTLKYSKIPIVLMSGALKQQDAILAIEGGLKDILVKPFTMKQLMEKISPYLTID